MSTLTGSAPGNTRVPDLGHAPANAKFARFAWLVLASNLGVIVWGAYVRATKSGAGCGNRWPACGEAGMTDISRFHMLIEYTHRASVGLGMFLVIGMFVWAMYAFPRGHSARLGAACALFFTLTEAILGAGLVLFKLVDNNSSGFRVVMQSAHLINTFLLLAALTLAAWWGGGGKRLKLRGQDTVGLVLGGAILAMIALAVTGAITALADTVFPSASLIEGLRQDLNPAANLMLKLRPIHPLLAMAVGLYVVLIAGLVNHLRPSPQTSFFARSLGVLFLVQLVFGFFDFVLLAPIWLQLEHLFLADVVWINLVLLTASALAEGVPHVERLDAPDAQPGDPPLPAATWREYVALTKPRVISLLLFTTLTAMVIAHKGWPGTWLFLAVALGGYMAAGAANTINMVIDRDIDLLMKRTAKRPTVTQQIPSRNALIFALVLAAGSFGLLWSTANLLAALLAFAGLVFYVIVYTLILKRRTWHNIVIGGAAGAFPPLVGWAAVTNNLSSLAWLLFAIVFVWTPVHFWALALLIKDDYADAGVPMAPLIIGDRYTVLQIGLYGLATAFVSVVPFVLGQVGWVYLVAAVALNATLLARCLHLYRQIDRPRASSLFHYSMLYLALLFLVMAVDRTLKL